MIERKYRTLKRKAIYLNRNTMRISENENKLDEDDNLDEEVPIEMLIDAAEKAPLSRSISELQVIIGFLNKTKLLDKFQKENLAELQYFNIMTSCAQFLNVQILQKGEILFRIEDVGNKFYIIIKGKVGVLRPVERIKSLLPDEYYTYLKKLRSDNESYMLEKTLRANYELMPLQNAQEFERIDNLLFKIKCKQNLSNFESVYDVEYYFHSHGKNKDAFGVDLKYMQDLFNESENRKIDSPNINKSNLSPNNKSSEQTKKLNRMVTNSNILVISSPTEKWMDYVSNKMNVTQDEIREYTEFREFLKSDRKDFVLYEYDKFMFIPEGKYFGDFALDKVNKKRTATIQAEDDCVLGIIEDNVYEEHIFTEKQKVKTKEVQFINYNCIFKAIKIYNFEVKYFHHFFPQDLIRGIYLFKQQDINDKIILVREGKIEVTFEGSIQDIFNMLKMLVSKFYSTQCKEQPAQTSSEFGKSINKESKYSLHELKKYLDDPYLEDFELVKFHSENLLKYVSIKRKVYLFTISQNEFLGLEEFFFRCKN